MKQLHRLAPVWIAIAAVVFGSLAPAPAARADVISDNLSAYTGANAQGYLGPLKEAIGQELNTGLYSSAFIPTDHMYFRLEAKGFRLNFKDEDRTFRAKTESTFPGNETIDAPTVIGDTIGVRVNGPGGTHYNFPGGLDIERLTLGAPQITIGGIKGFELTARYFAVDVGNNPDIGKIKLIGGALRYGISGALKLPLDASLMLSYQKFKLGEDFIDSKAMSYGLQVGKQLSLLDIYGGVGMDRFSMDVAYDTDSADSTAGATTIELPAETDFHFAAGATLHLSVLHLNAEYNHAARSSIAVGVGLGNR